MQHFPRKVEGGITPWLKLGNPAMAAEPSEPSEFSPLTPSSPASYDLLARHASRSSKKHKVSYATTTIPNPVGAACMHSPC